MNHSSYTPAQLAGLVTLRMLVGWHLLYQGALMVWTPGAGTLHILNHDSLILRALSRWDWHGAWITAIDLFNAWGLAAAGCGLILGLFGRAAVLTAALVFVLYAVAHLPLALPGLQAIAAPFLLEAAALTLLITFPTCHLVGADRLRLRLPPWRLALRPLAGAAR